MHQRDDVTKLVRCDALAIHAVGKVARAPVGSERELAHVGLEAHVPPGQLVHVSADSGVVFVGNRCRVFVPMEPLYAASPRGLPIPFRRAAGRLE